MKTREGMRTRGFNKDLLIDMAFNIAKEFEQNYYWKNDEKHEELKERLKKIDKMIEQRKTLVK